MTITIHTPQGIAGVGISLRGIDGIITIRQWPDFLNHEEQDGEWEKWRSSLSPREWDKYLVPLLVDGREQDYAHNLLTNDGISTILKNLSFAAQASLEPFAQILSVGNGTLAAVARADTSVVGDGFGTNARRAPNTTTITGNQVQIDTNYLSGDAQATWSNVGFYGWNYGGSANATTTTGTGSLKTHSLFVWTKGTLAVTVSYIFVLNN